MIPAKYSADGRLLLPDRYADTDDFQQLLDKPLAAPAPKPDQAMLARVERCLAFLTVLDPEIVEWCRDTGCPLDTVRLVFVGAFGQSVDFAKAVISSRPLSWIRPRVQRLKAMGLWVGGRNLGERFGPWIEEGENHGLLAVLDVLEIEGLAESKLDDNGERLWRMSPEGEKRADKAIARGIL